MNDSPSARPARPPEIRRLADALFRPGSVALIGASADPAKTAARPLAFLRRHGYGGRLYPVNPGRPEIDGVPAYANVADLPAVPDHAYVLTSTEAAVEAVGDCARLGVPVVTVLADGFAEAGPEGAARERRLTEIAAEHGTRLLGPNSLGLIDTHTPLALTANAAFAEEGLPPGRLMVVSQSGSMMGALMSRGRARGIDFARLVSVGNEADLSVGEICGLCLDDEACDGFLLFLESIRHGDRLAEFAAAAARAGKPVVAYKLGRSAAARALAVTHTGALLGDDGAADAFLRDCGIARLTQLEALLEAMPMFLGRRRPPEATTAVGVVTTTGGGAAMVVDCLGALGMDTPGASEETLGRLAALGIEVKPGPIVDLTLAGARYAVMRRALEVLRSAPEFGLLVVVAGSSARLTPEETVQPIIDAERTGPGTPLAAFVVPEAPDSLALLAKAGIAAFRTPEACADAIRAFLARRPPRVDTIALPRAPSATTTLDEATARERLAAAGIAMAPSIVLETGAPVPELPFEYPVAAKALSDRLAHKTEAGGVALDIPDAAALAGAVQAIAVRVQERTGTAVDKVLVSPMLRGVQELLLGFRRDPETGPLVMLAAGGTLAELHSERAIHLAPVDEKTAWTMIDELPLTRIAKGFRGGAAGDLDALVRAIVALSRLADAPDIVEAEINPLLVMPAGQGAVALDALVVTVREDET